MNGALVHYCPTTHLPNISNSSTHADVSTMILNRVFILLIHSCIALERIILRAVPSLIQNLNNKVLINLMIE